MLRLVNVPYEVFAVALDYEQIERPDELEECPTVYENETTRRAWTQGGLEKAIYEYLSLSGAFDEETGEFAGCSGYSYSVGGKEIEMVS